MIATTLDAENTSLQDSCIQFYMFTGISDMYTKYATYILVQNKCHKFESEFIKKRPKRESCTWKEQMPLPNIHLNNGTYRQSGKEIKNVSAISYISSISQVYADKPK